MIEYKSCFAKSMQDMVDYRVSLGYIAASYENRLKRLDTFIAENYPSEATLTKQWYYIMCLSRTVIKLLYGRTKH